MTDNAHAMLFDDMARFTHDPLKHALYAYPWDTERLPQPGPRTWQRETMQALGEHLRNPATRHQPFRDATASGHGIGKSGEVGMLVKWALDTCADTRVVVTANTETQIINKTWPEVTKWSNLAITNDWFKPTATGLISTQVGHDRSWRADAVTWSENNTEAFAGLHNLGKRIVVVFDEASGIADSVWEVAQGALTDAGTELIWIVRGNPTKNTGRFRECFGRYRNLWKTRQIDSRTVEGTNKDYLDEIVETYGLDSDIVKVRVLGQFPSASSMQFIGSDVVAAARARPEGETLRTDPVVFGVDCARFGDDHSTLAIRSGRDARSRPWKRWHNVDAMTLAGDIAIQAGIHLPDAIFVDAGNIGAAVVDRLRQLIPDVLVSEVWFGAKSMRDAEFNGMRIKVANKRAEMWTNMREWLGGGWIPDHQGLADDLINPEYGFDVNQRILLEKKEHMKARGLPSTDDADALACTFAEIVAPRALPSSRQMSNYSRPRTSSREAYDPYA
jgi:hypothetical protein